MREIKKNKKKKTSIEKDTNVNKEISLYGDLPV